jgi:hypothetical protein
MERWSRRSLSMFYFSLSHAELSVVSSGDFFCTHCGDFRTYELKQVRRQHTVWFIPVGSSVGEAYVECCRCGSRFSEKVLRWEPATEAERVRLAARKALLAGMSLGKVQAQLQEQGMAAEDAEGLVLGLCEAPPKRCACGRRFHPYVFQCDDCGVAL